MTVDTCCTFPLQDQIRRWGLLWMYSLLQTVMFESEPRPEARALLTDEELADVLRQSRRTTTVGFIMRELVSRCKLEISEVRRHKRIFRQDGFSRENLPPCMHVLTIILLPCTSCSHSFLSA